MGREIPTLWRQAASEQQRARRAGFLAARYAAESSEAAPSLRPLYARMADLHRRVEARHRASAAIHESYARRLEAWLAGAGSGAPRPVFMAAVAAALGTASAAATLCGQRRGTRIVAVSDPAARAASDVEIVTGEGPGAEAAREGALVSAAGCALRERWPQYGPAVTGLGMLAVVAVPMRVDASRLGVLCAYSPKPVVPGDTIEAAVPVADALAHSLLTARAEAAAGGAPVPLIVEEADYQDGVHQATGMVSVQFGCEVGDAEALLRARAFAEDQPVEEIARRVVDDRLRLC